MDNYINVYIQKPVYSSFVYVRDKYLKQAKREEKHLKISCPVASCIVSPDEWLKDAQKIEKVFLMKDRPMILFGNHIAKFSKHE